MNKFSGINFSLIENIEEAVWQWFRTRKYRIPLFIVIVVLFVAISRAPYINLFLDSYFIILISAVISPFVLKIDAKPFIMVALLLFLFAFALWFSDKERAEMIGNYIFIFLLSGVARAYFSD